VIRNGINFPWGNPDSSLTLDPFKKKIPIAKPFHLKLERTDSGFVMSYADLDGKNPVSKEYPGTADIVQVCEKNKMYLGFFAARNAKMTVSNAKLVLREAHTRPGTPYTLKPYDQFFEIESSDGSSSESYALVARSGYSGSLTVVQDEKTALAKAEIKAGEFYTFNTKLVNRMTSFELVFTPAEGPSSGPIKKNITVEKRDYGSGELIASPDGKADGNGTIQNPLDIATAIKFVNPGETIFLRGGNYGNIVIPRLYSGLDRKLKKLSRYKKEKPVVAGFQTFASYWHLYGIESAGSKTYGIWIEGSNNIIEQCVSHDSQNSGFQMDSPVHNVPLRSGNNLYQNCDSYDNVDPTMENADGYAAKTFTGTGNIYRGCISHNNADDGWDFFNNMQDGPIGAIVLENCIAYDNGVTTKGKTAGGAIGNGFKLGGEGQPVAHVIRNSIAFHNKMDGFTCNFNPGSITVEHCTAFDNSRCNYIFRSNPYIKPSGTFVNNISYRTDNGIKINDFIAGSANEYNLFWFGKNDKVKSADFVSLKVPSVYSRDERGGILLGDFLTLKSTSALAKGGKNKSFMGAIPPAKK
jgi:pectate disaccharide-lyase